MEEKSTTVERLTELLDIKDEELDELRKQVSNYERAELDHPWSWCIHSESKDEQTLSVPRLELRWTAIKGDRYNWLCTYALVYRHLCDQFVTVPLGCDSQRRGRLVSTFPTRWAHRTPFRDGCHIRSEIRHLNLRGFAICGDVVSELTPRNAHGSWPEDQYVGRPR